jgi:hypothetical protein
VLIWDNPMKVTSTKICLIAVVPWVASILVGKSMGDGITGGDKAFYKADGLTVVDVIAFTLLKFILEVVIDKKSDSKSGWRSIINRMHYQLAIIHCP